MPDNYAWGGEFCFPGMQNVTRLQSPYGYWPITYAAFVKNGRVA